MEGMSVNGYDGQRIESFLPSNCCICFRTRPQAPGSDVRTPTGCSAPGPWHPVLSHTALGLGRRVWQKILAVRGNFRRAKTPAPISLPSVSQACRPFTTTTMAKDKSAKAHNGVKHASTQPTTSDERPAKKAKLLDASDSESDSEEGGVELKVNEEYARRFEHNKKRAEMHRCEYLSKLDALAILTTQYSGGEIRQQAQPRRR